MTVNEFENWVMSNKDKLYRFAYSILLDNQSAEDIVQEVFISLWTKKDRHQLKNIDAWCYTICKNKCLNLLKRKKYEKKYIVNNRTQKEFTPEEYLQANQLQEFIEDIMTKLSGLQRAILYLKDNEDLNYEDIAGKLKITRSNVKIQVFRARKFIAQELKRKYNYGKDI